MNTNAIPPSWNTIAKAISLFESGERGRAFKMVGNMKIRALTKDEKKILVIAGEMMTLSASMYVQMGFKLEEVEAKAEAIFKEKIINK